MSCLSPDPDCARCPRLAGFRAENRAAIPHGHNAPVPSFGGLDAPLLIVGLAPGLHGANTTGRPFTGDYAGDLLYTTLIHLGLANGHYQERADDGLTLIRCRITNAVRCVPPHNKPLPNEIKECNAFLRAEIESMPSLQVILTLGGVAHQAALRALGAKPSAFGFAHGATHRVGAYHLVNSYHCSRYNTNTGRLTAPMFEAAMRTAIALLK